jgi:Tol biopolymer transport system component
MKKTILLVAACVVSLLANAQVLDVVSMEQLNGATYEDARVAGVSPDGKYVLMTTGTFQGLKCYDIASGKTEILSNAASAGFDIQISRDGQKVVFEERTFHADRTSTSKFVQADLQKHEKKVMAKQEAFASVAQSNVLLTNEEGILYITRNGKRVVVAPFGTEDRIYIWASLSPDNSKICYHLSGLGTYICNLDGSNNQLIGRDLLCPQWYDNNILVGTHERDNGQFITAAAIVAYTLDGKVQILTGNDMIAMDPHTANGKIVFSTAEGKTYMMSVK